MAFLRLKDRGDTPERGLTSKKSGQRWVVVPVVGAALALWSVATMAGLYSLGTSLTAASNSLAAKPAFAKRSTCRFAPQPCQFVGAAAFGTKITGLPAQPV